MKAGAGRCRQVTAVALGKVAKQLAGGPRPPRNGNRGGVAVAERGRWAGGRWEVGGWEDGSQERRWAIFVLSAKGDDFIVSAQADEVSMALLAFARQDRHLPSAGGGC